MNVCGRLWALWEQVIRPDPQHGKSSQQQDDSPNNPNNPAPNLSLQAEIRITQDQPTPEEEQRRAAERDYWERQLRLAKWMNWITVVATVVGAGAAGVGLAGLWFINETLKATQRQATAEEDQAMAAREALRAQIIFTKAQKITDFAPNAPARVNIEWKNAGGSTAKDATVSSAVLICPRSEDQAECIKREITKANLFSVPPSGRGPIGAGVRGVIPLVSHLRSPETAEALKNQTMIPYFVGAVRYRDLFSNRRTPQSCTEVAACFYFETITGGSALCPAGNYEREEQRCYDEE